MKCTIIILFIASLPLIVAEASVKQEPQATGKLEGSFTNQLSFSLGINSLSVTESSESGGAFSGTSVNLSVEYPFIHSIRRYYFIKSSVPVISTAGTGLYSFSLGLNFFQESLSGPYRVEDGSSTLTVRPKTQYYWGPHLGTGAIIYTLDTAKKSDFAFLLGAQAGMIKQFAPPWGMKVDGGISKGFGMNSGFLTYFVSVGLVYDLE
jgi:hypothetical protein